MWGTRDSFTGFVFIGEGDKPLMFLPVWNAAGQALPMLKECQFALARMEGRSH
jgi:hypothetical protein